MIKYVGYAITFAEVPDEVSLTIQISNCPQRCKGCHSVYLQSDVGKDLEADLPGLLDHYQGRVTCVCFMGTGQDWFALSRLVSSVKIDGLRTALYTGYTEEELMAMMFEVQRGTSKNALGMALTQLFANLDYLKTGPYIEAKGGLSEATTNQSMYRFANGRCEDITSRFWKKKE